MHGEHTARPRFYLMGVLNPITFHMGAGRDTLGVLGRYSIVIAVQGASLQIEKRDSVRHAGEFAWRRGATLADSGHHYTVARVSRPQP